MSAEVRVFADAEELGGALAADILRRYDAREGPFLLGCPGGRSLVPTYRALAAAQLKPALTRLAVVMMDQYLGVPPDAHYCCRGFARRELQAPLGLSDEQVWLPDPGDPDSYDARIEAVGGIDLFLLASGASDGHVAFLGPGAPRTGRTAVVPLAESTRRDNLATFPQFRSLAEVPVAGVSVGLGTIADAQALRLVLTGAGKRSATARVLELKAFDPEWPASIVHDHPDAQIWVDREAHG